MILAGTVSPGVTSLLSLVWDIAMLARPATQIEADTISDTICFMKHSFQVGGARSTTERCTDRDVSGIGAARTLTHLDSSGPIIVGYLAVRRFSSTWNP